MGVVYRAFDPSHQRYVALKTLPHTEGTLLSRFKREFRVLAHISHPNIVKLFELSSDGETWFFTMEIIDGVDLMTHLGCGSGQAVAAEGRLDAGDLELTQQLTPSGFSVKKQQRILQAFAQLAEAIATMHASGIVHRDIKPSNVMITPEGRLVLLDFGLVAETDPSGIYQSVHQSVMGTAAYMSPEQAACEAVSAASDWYAVGVMLYQALTGQLPFSGKPIDILFNKQRHRPVPPGEIDPSLPREWNDLCMVLLSRNPANRPRADEIVQRLGGQIDRHTLTKASDHDEFPLVGRESHLQTLGEAWNAVRDGHAQSVLIEGRSGNGKSALVDAFIERATQAGAVVLKGRCYEMESVPFKAIDGLIDALVTYLSQLPEAFLVEHLHRQAKRLQLFDQHAESFGHAGLDDLFALDDGLVGLGPARHIIRFDG